ncbi:3-oxoacyl-ACP synthase OS=Lysinibacillus sphaericus OX=1421 GN=LS41612_12575 PE=4 SV=1 [Lysinibacillus sphaericus]
MYNLGAGGGAIVLQKNYKHNHLLEADIMTDGSFSEDVVVPVGGTKKPLTPEDLANNLYQLDVLDPVGMKERLEQKSLNNFLKVIRTSLAKSGLKEEHIRYIAMLHMKRSAHAYILSELGLKEEQSIYLQDYGHIGQIDQILSLQLALEQKRIVDGDIVTLVSAGIGYVWGAITIRWG